MFWQSPQSGYHSISALPAFVAEASGKTHPACSYSLPALAEAIKNPGQTDKIHKPSEIRPAANLKPGRSAALNMLGKFLPFVLTCCIGRGELQAAHGAGGNTGGLEALINAVAAQVALVHLAGLGVPLRRSPRAGGNAGLAAHAE